jgi:ABC-type Fe3+/spermidine/putrescine transport system ATPase subunit
MNADQNDTHIEITGLEKNFGKVEALRGVDLSVKKGESMALLGPSGCGKTTILQCVAGLQKPDAGVIRLGDNTVYDSGRKLEVPPHRRALGLVFQSYAIWPHYNVFDNIAFPLKMRGLAVDEQRKKVSAILETMDMAGYENRPATNLSGGQQQRVALARALVYEPEVILFDEPLSNLDAKLRVRMRLEIKKLIKDLDLTAIYVTHDQEEAFAIADRITVMEKGLIAQTGTPTEIYCTPISRYVANLIGRPSFLDATVKTCSLDTATMCVGENNVLVDGVRVNKQLNDGEALSVVVRSEAVSLLAEGEAEGDANLLRGLILEKTYMGDHFEYIIQLDKEELVAGSPRGDIGEPGQNMLVRLNPEQLAVLTEPRNNE